MSIQKPLETRFDLAKDKANRRKHGVSLELAFEMDTDEAIEAEDLSSVGERRWIALGPIHGDLFVLVYTLRKGAIRPISLRKAEKSEKRRFRERR